MNVKTMKILTTILSVVLMVVMGVSVVYGTTAESSTFLPNSIKADTTNTTGIQNLGSKIMGIIQVIGTIVSVVILIVLGIKYMMGSAEEKAEYKKTMIPYLVGAILIFAATQIATIIYNFAGSISAD